MAELNTQIKADKEAGIRDSKGRLITKLDNEGVRGRPLSTSTTKGSAIVEARKPENKARADAKKAELAAYKLTDA